MKDGRGATLDKLDEMARLLALEPRDLEAWVRETRLDQADETVRAGLRACLSFLVQELGAPTVERFLRDEAVRLKREL